MSEATAGRIIGRYALYDPLALGGMATVHIGRLLGPVGFARTVAIKRLHPQYARDPEFVSMFLDEARMCARIRHPNVVPTLDVVATQGELFLVMEYIQGESLSQLVKAARHDKIPWRVAIAIVSGALHGLHAAHEAKDERGTPMHLVHRDVSPQNILVGTDGMARVVDFGIAKATGRIHTTREGAVKGKLGYMAYEQMSGAEVTRQSDVYAAAVVLWEALTCRRLFDGETEAIVLAKVLTEELRPPSSCASDIPPELDDIVMKGLSRDTAERYASAREMAHALDKLGPAPLSAVGEWVESMAKASLEERASKVAKVEEGTGGGITPATGAEPASQPTVARSGGSIRPTARSEYDTLPPAERRLPRWVAPVAGGCGVALLAVLLWTAFRGGGADAGAAVTAVTTGAPAATAPSPPPATEPHALPSAAAVPSEAVAAESTAAPSTSVPSVAATPSTRPSGRMPTAQPTGAKTGSPWSLGGRK